MGHQKYVRNTITTNKNQQQQELVYNVLLVSYSLFHIVLEEIKEEETKSKYSVV